MQNLYAERDIENLNTYPDHVYSMIAEELRGKSDIAAELAYRDSEIIKLKDTMEVLIYQFRKLVPCTIMIDDALLANPAAYNKMVNLLNNYLENV